MMQAVVHVLHRLLSPYPTTAAAGCVAGHHRALYAAIRDRNAEAAREVVRQGNAALRKKYLATGDRTIRSVKPAKPTAKPAKKTAEPAKRTLARHR